MMSAEQIRALAVESARNAEKRGFQPYHPECAEDLWPGRCTIPGLGNYVPKGWKALDKTWFVDKIGCGVKGGSAITQEQFLEQAREWFYKHPAAGFAVVEEGEFQVVVRAFEKMPESDRKAA